MKRGFLESDPEMTRKERDKDGERGAKSAKTQRIEKSMKSLIHVNYDQNTRSWKIIKKASKFLDTMGVPGPFGTHSLYPEEMASLFEVGCAIAFMRGKQLQLLDILSIMGNDGFPSYKYIAYKQLRKTGFVVVRHRKPLTIGSSTSPGDDLKKESSSGPYVLPEASALETTSSESGPSSTSKEIVGARFSQDLLDMFPSVVGGKLRMLNLGENEELNPLKEPLNIQKTLSDKVLRVSTKAELERRDPREARRPLPPPYWPSLREESKRARNWREYREMREQAIQKARDRVKNRSQPVARPVVGVACVDYDIYHPGQFVHSVHTPPAFHVIVVEGHSRIPSISHLISDLPARHVMAVVTGNVVSYTEQSGQAIDIWSILKARGDAGY